MSSADRQITNNVAFQPNPSLVSTEDNYYTEERLNESGWSVINFRYEVDASKNKKSSEVDGMKVTTTERVRVAQRIDVTNATFTQEKAEMIERLGKHGFRTDKNYVTYVTLLSPNEVIVRVKPFEDEYGEILCAITHATTWSGINEDRDDVRFNMPTTEFLNLVSTFPAGETINCEIKIQRVVSCGGK